MSPTTEQKKAALEAKRPKKPDTVDSAVLAEAAPPAPAIPKSELSLSERVAALEASVAHLKAVSPIPRELTPQEIAAKTEQDAKDDELKGRQNAECELRKYIKRGSVTDPDNKDLFGFRKGITPEQKARAKELMKQLDRKQPVCDFTLLP